MGSRPGRIQPPENRFRDRLTAEHAAVEGAQERIRRMGNFRNRQRLGGQQHRHQRNPQRTQLAVELQLPPG